MLHTGRSKFAGLIAHSVEPNCITEQCSRFSESRARFQVLRFFSCPEVGLTPPAGSGPFPISIHTNSLNIHWNVCTCESLSSLHWLVVSFNADGWVGLQATNGVINNHKNSPVLSVAWHCSTSTYIISLIFTKFLGGRESLKPHCTDDEIGVQKGHIQSISYIRCRTNRHKLTNLKQRSVSS